MGRWGNHALPGVSGAIRSTYIDQKILDGESGFGRILDLNTILVLVACRQRGPRNYSPVKDLGDVLSWIRLSDSDRTGIDASLDDLGFDHGFCLLGSLPRQDVDPSFSCTCQTASDETRRECAT